MGLADWKDLGILPVGTEVRIGTSVLLGYVTNRIGTLLFHVPMTAGCAVKPQDMTNDPSLGTDVQRWQVSRNGGAANPHDA
ncbi:MAG TPA: hypothetical protein VFE46_14735 [Pirellulales bacterium]|jgi:hypothetical protein|nr:hypothetical protein [Pirellulales bacterium]